MTITLPDAMRAALERKAAAAGFASVDEFVVDALTDDYEAGSTRPPHFRTREELHKLLDEGMASGVAGEMDDAFWAERRRVLAAKMSARNGGMP